MTGAQALVADQPFATLDPTLRKIRFDGSDAILADTVGFITDLPKELVAAFQATLEEVTDATLLVHVIDVSNPFWHRQRDAVEALLAQLGAGGTPTVIAWNKIDVVRHAPHEAGVAVSAKTGAGLLDLKVAMQEALHSNHGEATA